MTMASRLLPSAGLATLVLLTALSGCSSRPDIVGHNSDAQDWAQEQRRVEAQKRTQLPDHRPAPEEAPQPVGQPAPAK